MLNFLTNNSNDGREIGRYVRAAALTRSGNLVGRRDGGTGGNLLYQLNI